MFRLPRLTFNGFSLAFALTTAAIAPTLVSDITPIIPKA